MKPEPDEAEPPLPKIPKVEYPDDAYHMVTQLPWEDDVSIKSDVVKSIIMGCTIDRTFRQKSHNIYILLMYFMQVIWNGEDVKAKIMSTLKQRGAAAGWLPCSSIRTAGQFDQQVNIQGE